MPLNEEAPGRAARREGSQTSQRQHTTSAGNVPARRLNAKAKGTRNEHRSIKLLEAGGYRCSRSAASLGEWDIVAIGTTDVLLVQCKTNQWPGSAEMEMLQGFPAPPNCRKLVHRWRDRQRTPGVREVR